LHLALHLIELLWLKRPLSDYVSGLD